MSESESDGLTAAQKARIEKNRQKALLLKRSKVVHHPYLKNVGAVESLDKNVIQVNGSNFVDSGGGFLIEENQNNGEAKEIKIVETPPVILPPDRPTCDECQEEFVDSYLFQHFNHPVCDRCRDEEKHALITKTEAKSEYLLKDCDLDKREPLLKFIVRKNPHNVRWGEMKLYLLLQIEKRALEVYGSEEKLEEERENREEKRVIAKTKKYNKNIKALRMNVRSSLYNRTTAATHEHEFGPETYNEEDDNYNRTCITCKYHETFEKICMSKVGCRTIKPPYRVKLNGTREAADM